MRRIAELTERTITAVVASCGRGASGFLDFVKGLGGAAVALRESRRHFRYELAVGAIFRDEAEYLEEWLRFHRFVGVQHFYLYDNGSTDRSLDVLGEWIEAGDVTVVPWPGEAVQRSACADCLRGVTRYWRSHRK